MKTTNYTVPGHISVLDQSEIVSYLREGPSNYIQEEKDKNTSFASIKGKISSKTKFVLSFAYFVLLIYFSVILFM